MQGKKSLVNGKKIHTELRIRVWLLILSLHILLSACNPLMPQATQLEPGSLPPSPLPTASAIYLPTETRTKPVSATPTAEPVATLTPEKVGYTIRYHPDGGILVGDKVSIEVISPPGEDMNGRQVTLVYGEDQQAQAGFSNYGIAGRTQATFLWVWDTSSLQPGDHQLTFSIEPGGPTWNETIILHPQDELPFPGRQATWAVAESDCCLVHYITGTACERDLEVLLESMDEQAERATQVMGVALEQPIQVILLPRVLGHGGFASDGVWISYLDRNYVGNATRLVFHHEVIHVLDSRLGGELRPTILVEGLAVYLSGGHFKTEELFPRAAALLPAEPGCVPEEQIQLSTQPGQEACGLDRYIPLLDLVDNFYNSQHEIGYLEAAAFVEYMVNRWGWDKYSAFYRDIHNQPEPDPDLQERGGPQYRAINDALWEHFGLTFEQVEKDFLDALSQEVVSWQEVKDVSLMVQYFDSVRRYQQILDPSAYFATAWLPDGEQMRQKKIVGDYLRQPLQDENLVIELLFLSASQEYLAARYNSAQTTLEVVNLILDGIEKKDAQLFSVHPFAKDYHWLVEASLQAGYTPQRIIIESDQAFVWGTADGFELIELQFDRQLQGWSLPAKEISINQLWAIE